MVGLVDLKLRMYLALTLIFAVGFALMYVILTYMGASFYLILAMAVGFFALQWYISPKLMEMAAHLHFLEKDENMKLQLMVKDLANTARVPMPRIAIAPRNDPNAYVFGRTRNSSILVVHEGLLSLVNDNELRAVLAHEIGHLKHNDVVAMTMVSFLPMLVYMVAQNFMFSSMFGGTGNSRSNNSGMLMLIGVGAFVVYFVLHLIVLMVSRARETYADEYSAYTTKKPEDLASSLLKITSASYSKGAPRSTTAARAFYFADPYTSNRDVKEIEANAAELKALLPNLDIRQFEKDVETHNKGGALGIMNSLFATHPPAYKRLIFLAKLNKALKK